MLSEGRNMIKGRINLNFMGNEGKKFVVNITDQHPEYNDDNDEDHSF